MRPVGSRRRGVSCAKKDGRIALSACPFFCVIGLRQTVAADEGIPPRVSTARESVRRIAERLSFFV